MTQGASMRSLLWNPPCPLKYCPPSGCRRIQLTCIRGETFISWGCVSQSNCSETNAHRKRVGDLRHYNPETYAGSGNWLGIGLLHQGAPKLVAGVRVAEEQTAFTYWQLIIHNHLHPLTILPELRIRRDTATGRGMWWEERRTGCNESGRNTTRSVNLKTMTPIFPIKRQQHIILISTKTSNDWTKLPHYHI